MRFLIQGPMKGGKTECLRRIYVTAIQEGRRVLFVTHESDCRSASDGLIRTHDGLMVECKRVRGLDELLSSVGNCDVLLVDEVQFFELSGVLNFLGQIRCLEVEVYFAGLDYDIYRRCFPVTRELKRTCSSTLTLAARCDRCGLAAEYSTFGGSSDKDEEGNFIKVGTEGYGTICALCAPQCAR